MSSFSSSFPSASFYIEVRAMPQRVKEVLASLPEMDKEYASWT